MGNLSRKTNRVTVATSESAKKGKTYMDILI